MGTGECPASPDGLLVLRAVRNRAAAGVSMHLQEPILRCPHMVLTSIATCSFFFQDDLPEPGQSEHTVRKLALKCSLK